MATVLLVEDQVELRAVHAAFLEQHGFTVVLADDGESGLARAQSCRPDVIVLDHSLPHRTGIEVTRELKSNAATAGIPILLMTAHAYGAIGRKAREAGCDAFLAKPCLPNRLLQEIMRFSRPGTDPG